MHTVNIKMHGDQIINFHGVEINIHDILSIVLDGGGNIVTVNVEIPVILHAQDCQSIKTFTFNEMKPTKKIYERKNNE